MKKRYFLLFALMVFIGLNGCGNVGQTKGEAESNEVLEDTATETIVAEGEQEATPVPTPTPTLTPVQDTEKAPEVGYDYFLYDYLQKEGDKPVLGFNCLYKPVWYINNPFFAGVSFEISLGENLYFSSGEYEMIKEGKLIDFVGSEYGNVEEKEEIDTIYGKAKIYASENFFSGDSGEIAQLGVDDHVVTIIYKRGRTFSGNTKEYEGKLKGMLPAFFEAVEEKETKLELVDKMVSVEDLYEIEICDPTAGRKYDQYSWEDMKPVFGFNLIEGWRENASRGSGRASADPQSARTITYEMFKGDVGYFETFRISADEGLYNYFFGRQSSFELEEKAEIETPFGTAKVFYAVREDMEEPQEEEVAILKNLGNIIVFNYYYAETANRIADGYDGKLEELIAKLF